MEVEQLKIVTGDVLSKENIPPIVPVIEGMIYPGLNSISANPKIGKGWMVQQMANCITNGYDFLGQKTTKGKVLLVPLEESRNLIQERLRLSGNNSTDILIAPDRDDLLKAFKTREDLIDWLVTQCKQWGVKVCFIDPLVVLQNLPSRDDVQMDHGNAFHHERKVLDYINVKFEDIGCASVLIHHFNKTGSISGTQALNSCGSGHLEIHNKKTHYTLKIKCRNGFKMDDMTISQVTEEGKGLTWKLSNGKIRATELRIDILLELGMIPSTSKELQEKLKENRSKVEPILRELVESGEIEKFRESNERRSVYRLKEESENPAAVAV